MSYSSAQGRAQLLDELRVAVEALAAAMAELGQAYEWLDEQMADRLEDELFRPSQSALGRAQRGHADFSARHGLEPTSFGAASPGGHPGDARGAIERASGYLAQADQTLGTLQDSMLPVEVGDPDLRAVLSGVRETIAPLPGRARELLRVLGR